LVGVAARALFRAVDRAVLPVVFDARLAVVAVLRADLRADVAVLLPPVRDARAVLAAPRPAERAVLLPLDVDPGLRARVAVVRVVPAAVFAARAVPVDARFAVVVVRFTDLRAVVVTPFAPERADRPVRVAPRAAERAVRRAVVRVFRAPARTRSVVAFPVRLASRAASTADSVADEARDRTSAAVRRAVREPAGDTLGFFRRSTSATRSLAAVTPPWARPLTVSPRRSTTPAAAPTTRFPGGVSGDRGCGCVGAARLAVAIALPRSASAARPSSSRTLGKNSFSSSFTWCRTFSINTLTLAS
jgi:hypothetical protein